MEDCNKGSTSDLLLFTISDGAKEILCHMMAAWMNAISKKVLYLIHWGARKSESRCDKYEAMIDDDYPITLPPMNCNELIWNLINLFLSVTKLIVRFRVIGHHRHQQSFKNRFDYTSWRHWIRISRHSHALPCHHTAVSRWGGATTGSVQ